MENFIYSINATLPIFLIIILGGVLKKIGIIDEKFTKTADKYVFKIALPALVYKDLAGNNIRDIFRIDYVIFCFIVTFVCIMVIWILTDVFMKDESSKGAFIQGSYRSSAAILGLAFIENTYNDAGLAPLMIIGAVPLYNIFAVIILEIKGEKKKKIDFKSTVIAVFKNPILLAILFSLPFAFLDLSFPVFVEKAISGVASTASPLALISIGAGFKLKGAIAKIKPTIIASFTKLVLLAAIFLPLAIYIGYRNQELMAILIMLGSPATVSCYIMAKNTGNDAELTSSIIVVTTLFSSVTLTLWIYMLRIMGML
ncbi:AEC family transporter [Eubacterium xylanophilum]|uniref:AEC family transporter n=1 Tax=Eubacterium xylanophilum TaxID=39497 RepID=UPI00047A542B|nr:AEC family transporter [Eubacterium xylanophilum]